MGAAAVYYVYFDFLLRIKCFIAIIRWDMNARSGMSIPQISTAPLL